jgi:glycosyltransferase involved in cell wall biosynthesis
MPDISIIVPIYNAEKYLKKCIDSLLKQTKKELEFILINDGSTDSTHDIIKKYNDKRIKYFKNKNQGIGKTRNFGIEKATGKYIMFVDSDDYLTETACEELYDKVIETKADLVICDFYKVYDDGSKEKIKLPSFQPTKLKEMPNLILDINLAPWNKIYKTKLIKDNNIKFVEGIKYEDVPFVAEAMDRANKIAKLDSYVNYYVIHGNSETTVRDKRIFDILKIVDKIRNYFKNKKYMNDVVDKLTVRTLTNYNIQQRNQKDKKVGMEFLDTSFAYLKKEVPDYKANKYYENRGFLKRTIEKSKLLSKIYCKLYKNK